MTNGSIVKRITSLPSPAASCLPTGYFPPGIRQAIRVLPPGLSRALHECHAIYGAGYGATFANFLATASFAVAGNFRIVDHTGESKPLSLHIRFAGAPLSGKSAAHRRANAPIVEAMKEWPKRSLFNNVTLPALLRRIRAGSILTMLSMPEGRGHLGSQLGRSFQDLSDLYDGNVPSFDRADDDDNIAVHGPVSAILATCVNVQVDAQRKWLGKHAWDAMDSGYLFRLLMIETDELSIEGAGAQQPEFALLDYDRRIGDLLASARRRLETVAVNELPVIGVDSDAERVLRRAKADFEYMASTALSERHGLVFAVRLAENARRIAGCLHVFEGYDGPVSAELMTCAVTIAEYFGAQWLESVFPPEPISEPVLRAQHLLDYLYDYQSRWRLTSWRKSELEELAPNFGWTSAEMKEAIRSICGKGFAHVIPRIENGRRVLKLELDSYSFALQSGYRGGVPQIG